MPKHDSNLPGESPPIPELVFTPTDKPTRHMFTRRNESDLHGNPGLQDSLRDALRVPGRQVILYGDSGVGKSTLLKYAADDEGMEVLSISAKSKKTFDQLIDTAIREVTIDREVEVIRSGSTGGGFEAGVTSHVTIKGQLKNEKGREVRVELIEREPLLALAETMQSAGYRILAFDNFHNVDKSEHQAFGQAMEDLSDHASETGDVKMVLVGIGDDAATVVGKTGSVGRRTIEIGVPRMPDGEIETIFRSGFGLLGLKAQGDVIRQLVFYCDGFPFFAHTLGLAVAVAARRRGESAIRPDALDATLKGVARTVDASYSKRIARAIETTGDVHPRERVLRVLSDSVERQWLFNEVVKEYFKVWVRKSTDTGFLHVALAQLTKAEHGAVLTRSGTPGRYVYRFSTPYLRPYLRMVHFPAPKRSLY